MSRGYTSIPLPLFFFFLFLLLLLSSFSLCSFVVSSPGDRSVYFRYCVHECVLQSSNVSYSSPPSPNPLFFTVLPTSSPFPLPLRLLQWSPEDDCKYLCMQQHEQQLAKSGMETMKYYGKWPFTRVWGHQELFSSLFSWLNAIPHIWGILQYNRVMKKNDSNNRYSMKNYWLLYGYSYIHTWFWSAVFHCRDTVFTERMDYFFSTFSIMLSMAIILIRIGEIEQKKWG